MSRNPSSKEKLIAEKRASRSSILVWNFAGYVRIANPENFPTKGVLWENSS
jgi:hypothetical protein